MKSLTVLCAALLAVTLHAQPAAQVLPIPGSQVNGPNAELSVSGVHDFGGSLPTPWTALGPGAGSQNLATSWVAAQLLPPAGVPFLSIDLDVTGVANAPLALLVSAEVSTLSCTLPQGVPPCFSTVWVPGALATPFGTYHLALPPVTLVDGIGLGLGSNIPASTGPTQTYELTGVVPWSLASNFLAPTNLGVQALVADPTHPNGFRLTAAFTVSRWIQYCIICAGQ